ncbi:probable multidrug resistance-associated protein lethal(2)03659 isoform X2 [Anoplophora glabripennis]|uniref:probable multidrug resistance-associated protein lethal(2)03659 isoform X2 n=1 Tax=Anoplophora glabripennis TaxID=217634 RepID=UPI00087436AD|nr:probable multidrug resistance-associated protein lethal(2)03659 isoform X2 [Anoplophora glabripennis]
MDSSKKYENISPEVSTNFLSKLFFWNWQKELDRVKGTKQKPSFKRAIFRTFAKSYSIYGIYLFIFVVVLRSLQPIILSEYIQYYESPAKDRRQEDGWLLAGGVLLITFLNILIFHHSSWGCQRIGMRVRIACCSLVYRKLLKLSQASLGQTAAGQLVNLLSNDVQRFDQASIYLHYIWLMPLQCAAGFYVMYRSVGVAAFAGMTAMVLEAIPLQGYLSNLQGKLRFKIAQRTDHRVKLMSEIVSGIQVIKMYAWEKSFEKVVELARKVEVDVIKVASYLRGLYLGLTVFTDRLCLYLTLITYVLLGNRLTGNIVFSLAQLFNTIQLFMAIYFPTALSFYAEAEVSINRLEEFLLLEEKAESTGIDENYKGENGGTVTFTKANATWLANPIADTLIDINLEIKPGTLCCVVGNVGAGKTTLLQTILKELPLTRGKIEVTGTVSYASQEPWLFVSTVRNNILFGNPYLKDRYREVVRVCALQKDFEQFPQGDRTLVGERGVSLSGGQRARINLARAVYTEADIYLFDDPLSAVDTHVGNHLFEECIMTYLKNKTRILVTHQLQFLKKADLIIVMNNGKTDLIGTFNDLTESKLHDLQSPYEEKEHVKDYVKLEKLQSINSYASSIFNLEEEPTETQELIEKGIIPTSTYTDYCRSGASTLVLLFTAVFLIVSQMSANASDFWVSYWTNKEESGFIVDTTGFEKVSTNSTGLLPVKREVLLENSTQSYSSFADLSTDRPVFDIYNIVVGSREYYILVYTAFILASIILTPLSRNVCYLIFMNASKALHNQMFNNILQASMRFFDTNPSGRILNRFSKDMGTIDEVLPRSALEAIQVFLVMGGILAMVFLLSPWMIIPAILLGVLFYYFEVIYVTGAQGVKRLEGVTRAPVFSHISASLYGLPTIRSCGAEQIIVKEFDALQDQHTSTCCVMIVSSETFGFYLDIISLVFLSFVTFQFLIFTDEHTASATVGLIISQAMVLTGMLQIGARQTAEVAANMISVERVLQYCKLEKEGPFESLPTEKPPRDWPQAGKITFKNMYLQYDPLEAPVLRNLNIEIRAGEKVGIVGRTGAGKSSLIAALFRLAPIEGTIAIDEVDVSNIGLNDLRSNISIIPQEPVLFSATVRYNLDPFGKASDEALWSALDKVELKSAVESLDQKVSEGGSNFSAGQRQLVCLARAIIRNNKVLVMDEATANVDVVTDSLIQKTIRKNFRDCTVLTIAHRLNTIMDSDKVLVMDAGQAVEFAHPHELLQNPGGYFTKMVKETGITMETSLRKIAREDFEAKF